MNPDSNSTATSGGPCALPPDINGAGPTALEIAFRYRLLTENMSDLLCELDEQGSYLYLSPNYRDVLGWDPEALVGTNSLEVMHPDDRLPAQVEIQRAFATGYGRRELRVRHANGQWRWFDCIGRGYQTDDGRHRLFVICREITARVAADEALRRARDELEIRVRERTEELAATNRRLQEQIAERLVAEQSLRSSEERLRMMLERVPDVVLVVDRDGTMLYLGLPTGIEREGEPIGRKIYEYVPADQHERMRSAIEQVFSTGQPSYYEVQLARTGDWYATHVEPLLRDGRVVAAVGISANRTAQKRAEEGLRRMQEQMDANIAHHHRELAAANEQLRHQLAERERVETRLRESEQRFRAIAESNPVPVLISRVADGTILYANERLAHTIGVPLTELVGRHTTDFYVSPEDRVLLMQTMLRHGHVNDYELRVKRSDGTALWVWVSNQRIVYQGDDAVLTGFLDITHRKEVEDRLRHDQQLLKKMVELQDRDRQLVAYEIHDGLVQDITGALMFLEASAETEKGAKAATKQKLEVARKLLQGAINEARRLINGLRPPILDEAGVVSAIEHLAADMATRAKVDVRFEHEVGFSRLAPRLENTIYRIVQEALTNVHRHSRAHQADVRLHQFDQTLRITVRDEGIGFNPAEVAPNRLGLTGVQERARLFGGTARIISAPGQGTTIDVELPLSDVLEPEA
jgi:PAS domain S-box-containing protein